MTPTYSVCIISKGDDSVIEASLGSLLPQLDERFEVIVADDGGGLWRDGYLAELEAGGRIRRIITQRFGYDVGPGVSRGKGRQIAHMVARGAYEISSIDTDDILKRSSIAPLLSLYHEKAEGRFLVTKACSIAPRTLIDELGGYADINRGEDNHLWCRAWLAGKYVDFLSYDIVERRGRHDRNPISRLIGRYGWARDKFRIGVDAMSLYGLEKNPVPMLPLWGAAWLDARLRKPVRKVTTWDYALYFRMREKGLLALEERRMTLPG